MGVCSGKTVFRARELGGITREVMLLGMERGPSVQQGVGVGQPGGQVRSGC